MTVKQPTRVAETVSRHLAREALAFSYAALPPDVIAEAKRRVMDTLACAIGGFETPPGVIIQRLLEDLGGRPEATVVVSGLRTSCANAALANGVMVRSTEAMDRGLMSEDGVTQHAHPGEIIPAVIAVGERVHASGTDVIAAIVLGYQLLNRISDAMGGARAASELGWKPEIRAGPIAPLIVGKLLGLSEDELVNAVGIAGSYTGELGVMDNPVEGRTMARELKFPFAAYHGVLGALLAKHGFDGPARLFEGDQGFAEVLCRGRIDLERLIRRDDDFSIRYTQTKLYPVNGRLQGQIEALVRLVSEHDVRPEDVERVTIRTTRHVVDRLADRSSHLYPTTKETADHSAYYVAALAIVDRAVHLDMSQFTPERLADPRLRRMIDKVDFVTVPEWVHDQAPTEVELTLRTGRRYSCTVEYPKGHIRNPIGDADIEGKFHTMAVSALGTDKVEVALSAMRRLDELADIGDLTRTLVRAA